MQRTCGNRSSLLIVKVLTVKKLFFPRLFNWGLNRKEGGAVLGLMVSYI